MTAIINSAAAMPNSSMWLPIIISGLWSLICLWPRHDGGGIPYSLALVMPTWFIVGPTLMAWIIWAFVVTHIERAAA